MRRVLALALAVVLLPPVWVQSPRPGAPDRPIRVTPLRLEVPAGSAAFRMTGGWQLERSSHFGGYSALLAEPGGTLLAVSDRAHWLRFRPPAPGDRVLDRPQWGHFPVEQDLDFEALTADPDTGQIWIAAETRNAVARFTSRLVPETMARPKVLRKWPVNRGAEALLRLRDGRFVALAEAFASSLGNVGHPGMLFGGDPTRAHTPAARFVFAGPNGYRPTDMAELPDGRVLILMRRLLWPLPARFAGLLVLADPATLRAGGTWHGTTVLRLEPPLPTDNYEAIALEDEGAGLITLWLMSDANESVFQRTLLLRFTLDPKRLP